MTNVFTLVQQYLPFDSVKFKNTNMILYSTYGSSDNFVKL